MISYIEFDPSWVAADTSVYSISRMGGRVSFSYYLEGDNGRLPPRSLQIEIDQWKWLYLLAYESPLNLDYQRLSHLRGREHVDYAHLTRNVLWRYL